MNAIYWKPKALRQLRKLEAAVGRRIRLAVSTELSELTDALAARHVKVLAGHAYRYRLRVGDYRVFFEFDGVVRVVSIEEVRKRNERTY